MRRCTRCVCVPLHLLMTPAHGSARVPARRRCGDRARRRAAAGRGTFAWLATAFSLAAFVAAALSAHLIGLLTAGGLATRDAVLIGAMIGPMQVAGRLMEMAVGPRIDARIVGMLAFGLLAAAVALLPAIGAAWILALAVRAAVRMEQRRDDHRPRHRAGASCSDRTATGACSAGSPGRRSPARPSRRSR